MGIKMRVLMMKGSHINSNKHTVFVHIDTAVLGTNITRHDIYQSNCYLSRLLRLLSLVLFIFLFFIFVLATPTSSDYVKGSIGD